MLKRIKKRIFGKTQTPAKSASILPKPIYVFSAPRSGSGFIRKVITNQFGVEANNHIAGGPILDTHLNVREFYENVVSGKTYGKSHLSVNAYNLDVLHALGVKKMVVHIRDPRDILVSWFFQISRDEIKHDKATLISMVFSSVAPRGLLDMSEDALKEWLIDDFCDEICKWMLDWIRVKEEDNRFEIMISSFTTMRNDPHKFFNSIYHFVGIQDSFSDKYLPELVDGSFVNNFRKGAEGEYKTFFNSEQLKRLNGKIPKAISRYL